MNMEQIKQAIENLPVREQFYLLSWLDELANDGWDREMEADAASGALDRFAKQMMGDDEMDFPAPGDPDAPMRATPPSDPAARASSGR